MTITMPSRRPRLLFVCHEGSRTGAPTSLLRFVSWLHATDAAECGVLMVRSGELDAAFAQRATLHQWEAPPPATPLHRVGRALRRRLLRTPPHRARLLRHLADAGYDLVYVNSLVAGHVLLELAPALRCPVIWHARELGAMLRLYSPTTLDDFHRAQHLATRFVAASGAAADNLAALGVSRERIEVVPNMAPVEALRRTTRTAAEARASLGLTSDRVVIGGAGRGFWMKGMDVFLATARLVRRLRPRAPVAFVWLGALSREEREMLQHEALRCGIGDLLHLPGHVDPPGDYMQAFDLLFLSSREDTFPLTCLEAAALGVPTLCFAGAGGAPEFVRDDAGIVVDYLDVQAAAAAIARCLDDPALARRLGACAARRIADYDVERVAPRLLGVVHRVIGGARHAAAPGQVAALGSRLSVKPAP